MSERNLYLKPVDGGLEVVEVDEELGVETKRIVDDITIYDKNGSWIAVISAMERGIRLALRDVVIGIESHREAGIVHMNIRQKERW